MEDESVSGRSISCFGFHIKFLRIVKMTSTWFSWCWSAEAVSTVDDQVEVPSANKVPVVIYSLPKLVGHDDEDGEAVVAKPVLPDRIIAFSQQEPLHSFHRVEKCSQATEPSHSFHRYEKLQGKPKTVTIQAMSENTAEIKKTEQDECLAGIARSLKAAKGHNHITDGNRIGWEAHMSRPLKRVPPCEAGLDSFGSSPVEVSSAVTYPQFLALLSKSLGNEMTGSPVWFVGASACKQIEGNYL